ncbi:MAG: SBBP repeat-containing protein [Terracidiphilus sp.]
MNYFIGDDRERWHTGLPTYERLRYTGVYPGTDLIYYGNKENLEFDFQLSPGADPGRIQMRFEGARSLKIDGKGDMIVTANDGHIRFQKPVIYQPAEDGREDIVAGSFKILKNDTVGFAVVRYDRARPLIIDPIFDYSTYVGGYAEATAIAVDQNGEAYVTGVAEQGFPTTPGSYQPGTLQCSAEDPCPFVAKFNNTGTALLYSSILTGSGVNTAKGIALDANGDAFVVGSTSSTNFPITPGSLQTTNNASATTGFVTELNSTGTSLLYSTYLGGSTSTSVNGVAIDAFGNAYLTGSTQDTNFPTTAGAYRTAATTKTIAGSNSAFIAKLNPTGTALAYSTYLGGSGADASLAVAVDSAGEAYVGGNTTSSDFPVTLGAIQGVRDASNMQAGFVSKLNASGSALVYSTYLSGKAAEYVNSIALDSNANVYATGSTISPDFPITAGAFQPNIGYTSFGYPQVNAFVSELNSAGTSMLYSTFLGGGTSLGVYADEGDEAEGIAVDGQGMVYLTGMACTEDFPVTIGAFEFQNLDGETTGECTAFLTKMNPAPNTRLLYSTFLGGTGNGDAGDYFYGEGGNGLALDSSGNVYLAGFTLSVDFPTTAGVVETAFTGPSKTAFITEFNGSEMMTLPIPTVTLTSSTSSVLFGQPVTFTATVQSANGSNTPTGYVGFNFLELEPSDNEGIGVGFGPWTPVALNGSGVATFTTSSLEALQTPVNAFYLGDANNAPARGTMTQTVMDLPTVTTVTSSANNVPYGSPVQFTATVLDSNGNPAKGFVFFMLGNTAYAQPNLNSTGQATWTNGNGGPTLPVGTDAVEVEYFPNTGYQKSSGTIAETFTPLGTTPDPTFTPPGGSYTSPQQVMPGDANSSALVYYTTDGSTPMPGVSPSMPVGFEITIPVNANETINAVAVASGYSPSNVVSAAYTFLPPPSFAIGPGGTTAMTVTRGSTSGNTGTVSMVGANGFNAAVNLTCSVTTTMTDVNDWPTCRLNPISVSISGTAAQTSTLTVTTTAAYSAENRNRILFWVSPGGTALALALFFGGFRKRRASGAVLGLLMLFVSAGISACGGGSGGSSGNGGGGGVNSGTTVGTYTITVTGVSGTTSATVGTVALTVQ